jgi:hypothetical protein
VSDEEFFFFWGGGGNLQRIHLTGQHRSVQFVVKLGRKSFHNLTLQMYNIYSGGLLNTCTFDVPLTFPVSKFVSCSDINVI